MSTEEHSQVDSVGYNPRETELTATLGREKFDLLPEGITDPEDVARWDRFVVQYKAAHALEFVGEFPLQLDFELNSTCQLKCRFCVHGQEVVQKQFMGFDTYRKIILEGQQYGLVSIKLNYINEPLLIRDLERYITFAKDHGVLNVYFATNGLLLTEARSKSLIRAGVTKIMVSIDAATSSTYEAMRCSKKYETIVENIIRFIAVRDAMGLTFPLVRVNFLQTSENIGEADEFKHMWAGVADMIGYQTQVALPGMDDDLLNTKATRDEAFRCSFPYKMIVIDSKGSILPCCTFSGRHMPLGHIADMSIKEAWKSMQAQRLRQLHKDGEYQTNPICKHCVDGCS